MLSVETSVRDCPFDLTPEFYEKVAKIKRPPFDFKTSKYLDKHIDKIIKCIENEDWSHLNFTEDWITVAALDVKDIDNRNWVIDYYYNRRWYYDD